MKFFKKPNLFTPIIILAIFDCAFRFGNIVTFHGAPVAARADAIKSASAVETPKEAVNEEPPPITKEDLEKVVKNTAKAADSGATDDKAQAPASPAAAAPAASATATTGVAPSPSFSSSEIEVLQSLAQRRDELDKREKGIGEREALLKAAEQEVDKKIAELNKLKGDMENLLGQQQKAEGARLASLIKIYENMKPKEAARIFDELDMNILLDVIGGMNERKASPVLAEMSPEKAKDVTIKLAEQRKLPSAGKEAAKK